MLERVDLNLGQGHQSASEGSVGATKIPFRAAVLAPRAVFRLQPQPLPPLLPSCQVIALLECQQAASGGCQNGELITVMRGNGATLCSFQTPMVRRTLPSNIIAAKRPINPHLHFTFETVRGGLLTNIPYCVASFTLRQIWKLPWKPR